MAWWKKDRTKGRKPVAGPEKASRVPEGLMIKCPDCANIIYNKELADNLNVFSWDPATRTAHARVFAAAFGVPEDAATGSAALAFGIYLAAAGLVGEGTTGYTIHQGAELHRPSTLSGTVTVAGGQVTATSVGGAVAPVAAGRLAVPR